MQEGAGGLLVSVRVCVTRPDVSCSNTTKTEQKTPVEPMLHEVEEGGTARAVQVPTTNARGSTRTKQQAENDVPTHPNGAQTSAPTVHRLAAENRVANLDCLLDDLCCVSIRRPKPFAPRQPQRYNQRSNKKKELSQNRPLALVRPQSAASRARTSQL